MLDSLNKIFGSIAKALGSSGVSATESFRSKVGELENRLQNVANKAHARELVWISVHCLSLEF